LAVHLHSILPESQILFHRYVQAWQQQLEWTQLETTLVLKLSMLKP